MKRGFRMHDSASGAGAHAQGNAVESGKIATNGAGSHAGGNSEDSAIIAVANGAHATGNAESGAILTTANGATNGLTCHTRTLAPAVVKTGIDGSDRRF
jgi:hypothetical protein